MFDISYIPRANELIGQRRRKKGRSIFPCFGPLSETALKESEYRNGVRYPPRETRLNPQLVVMNLERLATKDESEGEREQLEPSTPHSACPLKVDAQDERAEKPVSQILLFLPLGFFAFGFGEHF